MATNLKQYLTVKNIALAVLIVGIIILLSARMFSCNKPDPIPVPPEQEKILIEMRQEVRRLDSLNKLRTDSLAAAIDHRETVIREKTIVIQKEANDKIDRINSAGFNSDSLRNYFATN